MNELTLESLAKRLDTLERQISRLLPTDADPPGTGGDEQSDDPEAVSHWLATFDAIPPATMTVDEGDLANRSHRSHMTLKEISLRWATRK